MVFFRIPLGGGHWVFGFTVLVIFEIGFSVFLSEERSDELIEIANRGWPLNTGPLRTYDSHCSYISLWYQGSEV